MTEIRHGSSPAPESSEQPESIEELTVEGLVRQYESLVFHLADRFKQPTRGFDSDELVSIGLAKLPEVARLVIERSIPPKARLGYIAQAIKHSFYNEFGRRGLDAVQFSQFEDTDGKETGPLEQIPDPSQVDPARALQEMYEKDEQLNQFYSALARLTDDQKQVITCALRGMTQVEMARTLELPLTTIKRRVKSAMDKLRWLVAIHYPEEE